MSIEILSKNLELTEEERQHIEEKTDKLLHISKNAENEESIKIKFDVEKDNGKDKEHQFSCSITAHIPGKTLRSESHGTGTYTVIDDAVKKMETQIKKEKGKHNHI